MANPQKASSTYAPGMPVRNFGDLTGEKYIEERLNDQLRYYDRTATKGKRRYLQSRFVSVVAAALVPVFVNSRAMGQFTLDQRSASEGILPVHCVGRPLRRLE